MYRAEDLRYDGRMLYRHVGMSGLRLPVISLGLWHNFGSDATVDTIRSMLCRAFDLGITHFDLANNYGPIPGSAESHFGQVLQSELSSYRDELIVSTKAGYTMWEGPYGDWGSKKYLVASLEQSLKRMNLQYVDIFYHHRPDPNTPMEETACALDLLVRQGKALYIGISNYNAEETEAITKLFKELKTPFIIHQACYNMTNRWIENDLTNVLKANGTGLIVYCPLAQGLLTDRYREGIPMDSRVTHSSFLQVEQIQAWHSKVEQLTELAKARNQTMAEFAISWILRLPEVTSVLIGASKVSQIEANVRAVTANPLSQSEIMAVERILEK